MAASHASAGLGFYLRRDPYVVGQQELLFATAEIANEDTIAIQCALECSEDEDGNRQAPETIMVIPAGDRKGLVHSRDGRVFRADRDAIIKAANGNDADLLLDREHQSLSWINAGGPAAGWLVSGTFRKQGRGKHAPVVADVKWTEEGRADVEGLRYRYVSPAFDSRSMRTEETKDGTVIMNVERMINAGIVNMPALRMPALAASEETHTTQEPDTMNLSAFALALGLAKDASEADILAAAAKYRETGDALVALQTEFDQLKTDHAELSERADKATERADKLEEELKTERFESQMKLFRSEIESLASGEKPKITPADVEYYLGEAEYACRRGPEEIERFSARLKRKSDGKSVLAETENLGERKAPKETITAGGMTLEQIEAQIANYNARKRPTDPEMTMASFVAHNPQYAALLTESASQ